MGSIPYTGVQTPTYKHPSEGKQGTMPTSKPFSATSKGFGKPTPAKTDGAQGIASSYRGVKQGQFSGDAKYARNTKQLPAQAAPATAWPNQGTVQNGRLRNRRG